MMEYTLKLTVHDLDVLSAALGELPYKAAAPLVAKINRQIAEQEKKSESEEGC